MNLTGRFFFFCSSTSSQIVFSSLLGAVSEALRVNSCNATLQVVILDGQLCTRVNELISFFHLVALELK